MLPSEFATRQRPHQPRSRTGFAKVQRCFGMNETSSDRSERLLRRLANRKPRCVVALTTLSGEILDIENAFGHIDRTHLERGHLRQRVPDTATYGHRVFQTS